MAEKYYNIHGIIKFKIVNKTNFFAWKFSDIHQQYKNFECQKVSDPDFTIYLGKFTPSNQHCYITGDRYYVREDYFYCEKDSYKLANWKFEMTGFESDHITVRISSNLIGYMFMLGGFIDFLVDLKMVEKGCPLVHASSVSKNGHALLFAASGGAGKTTVALHLVERGFDFLGDNFIILREGSVLSFLSPLNIFTYNLVPLIKKNLGAKKRINFNLRDLLYRITSGYIKMFMKINVKDVFPSSLIDKSQLDTIFLLIPRKEFHIEDISKDELIGHMVMNRKIESLFFYKYMLEYSYRFPQSNLSTYWDRYKENLTRNLNKNISLYKLEVPPVYDMKTLERISEAIQDKS